ncbi:TetR/AcrR family transcriptional regulator [Rhizosphaericola mali]|uniref:TetR/AcrR family transcriptional regulator n=1 Tax=Rhizosphaericola mali TaxID=2545455 RepID=A0A5P2G1J1_9BACT|nr:TetR/AcrR family transcriptional regulator [Rhizosphaericola mali]QES87702.1 TetR/AcrR family transcriptional regulator [Rhizosphaericola mali]
MASIQDELLQEQILKAALQLYQQYGLKKVTMDDVAKLLGKTRTSLYYYYKNRDEIFEAVLDMVVNDFVNDIANAMDKTESINEKLKVFCLSKIKITEERKAIFTSLEKSVDPDTQSTHSKTMMAIHKRLMKLEATLLKKNILNAIEKGDIKELNPKNLDSFIFIILSGTRGIKREMSYDNNFTNLNYVVNTLVEMSMRWLN